MRVALLLILLTACSEHGQSPADGPNGSGFATGDVDPSPPDITLELIVVGLSAVVIVGPVRSRRNKTLL